MEKQPLRPQQRVVLGPLLFTSDFDSGNMGRVEKVPVRAGTRGPWTVGGAAPKDEYHITVAPDCSGTPWENGFRTWFHFGVALAEPAEIQRSNHLSATAPIAPEAHSPEPLEALRRCIETTSSAEDEAEEVNSACEVGERISSQELEEVHRELSGTSEPGESSAQPFASRTDSTAEVPEGGLLIGLSIRNMNNQGKLYKEGYRPWVRNIPHDPKWRRLENNPGLCFTYEWGGDPAEGGTGFHLKWRHKLEKGGGTTFFAFCAPFSYAENQMMVDELEMHFGTSALGAKQDPQRPMRLISAALTEEWVPRVGKEIYFHRQQLEKSLEGRPLDLLTITSLNLCKGGGSSSRQSSRQGERSPAAASEADALPADLWNCQHASPARLFPGRPIVFISARVHPGETPAQFVFLGALRFLLSDDPRAVALRETFVFKLVPILNPDGVVRGHYRTNSRGLNLNRFYDKPLQQVHEGVWAVKRTLQHWSSAGRLLIYIDLHGHATKRGCFVLANRLPGLAQVLNMGFARLCQINSPFFDLEACDFTEEGKAEDKCKDGFTKEGAGRVAIYRDLRLCHAYTLECNYHNGRMTKPIHPPGQLSKDFVCPAGTLTTRKELPYEQPHWGQVGEAICVSVLDLYGHNCYSRVAGSRQGSLAKLLGPLRPRKGHSDSSDLMPNVQGADKPGTKEKPCGRQPCAWALASRKNSDGASVPAREYVRATMVMPGFTGKTEAPTRSQSHPLSRRNTAPAREVSHPAAQSPAVHLAPYPPPKSIGPAPVPPPRTRPVAVVAMIPRSAPAAGSRNQWGYLDALPRSQTTTTRPTRRGGSQGPPSSSTPAVPKAKPGG